MMLVRITRDMKPWSCGEDKLLDDALAGRLIAEGSADNPRDRFGVPIEPPPATPERRRRDYRTK